MTHSSRTDTVALLAGQIPLSPLADVSEDEWDGVITSHLKGHSTLIQAAAPIMKAKRYGRIVGFTSVQGTSGRLGVYRPNADRSVSSSGPAASRSTR